MFIEKEIWFDNDFFAVKRSTAQYFIHKSFHSRVVCYAFEHGFIFLARENVISYYKTCIICIRYSIHKMPSPIYASSSSLLQLCFKYGVFYTSWGID